MSTDPWPAGYGLIHLAEVDSTNAEAARRAPELAGPVWILADHQSAPRGRRGRAWVNPPGNLATTLVCRPVGGPDLMALRSFVAALALYDTFIALTARAQSFALKWPNDVLLNGGKVAGILLESMGAGGRVDAMAVGIGVNLVAAPESAQVEPGAVVPVNLLSETGVQVSSQDFLAHLAPAYARYETQLVTYGFAPIREAWLARAAKLGEIITARTAGHETIGTFETVDANGQLVLSTPKGRQAIAAADVFF